MLKTNSSIIALAILCAGLFTLFGQEDIPSLDVSKLFDSDARGMGLEEKKYQQRDIYTSSIDDYMLNQLTEKSIKTDQLLNDLLLFRLKKGIAYLRDYTILMSYYLQRDLQQEHIADKELDRLAKNANKLVYLDQTLPAAYSLKAQVTLKESPFYFFPALYYYLKGQIMALLSPQNLSYNVTRVIFAFHSIVFIAGYITFLVLLVKYFPLLLHELKEMLGVQRLPKPALLIVLLISLFWLYAGFLPFLIFFSGLIFLYMSNKERFILILTLASLVLTLVTIGYFKLALRLPGSEVCQSIIRSYYRDYDAHAVAELEKYDTQHKEKDISVKYALASFYFRKDKIFRALRLYKEINEIEQISEVALNTGNIFYILNDYVMAQSFYEKALELNPQSGMAYFNLAQLTIEKMLFSEDISLYFDKAKEYNPKLMDLYQNLPASSNINFVISAPLPKKYMLQTFTRILNKEQAKEQLSYMGIQVEQLPQIAIFSIVFILIVNLVRIRMDQAYRCKRCGKIYCMKCSSKFFAEDLCTSCHQVFNIKKGIHPKVRIEKLIRIDRNKRTNLIWARILTVLSLGGGYTHYGAAGKGFVLTAVYLTLFCLFFHFFAVLPPAFSAFVKPFLLAKIFLGLLLAGLLFNAFKNQDKMSNKYHQEK